MENWRFQQALYRAYYDYYNRARLIYETQIENEALDQLRNAQRAGALLSMEAAERTLNRAIEKPVAQWARARVFEMAEALFQSIRMQLSVPRYKAISVGRGATLDTIDAVLNDRLWLERWFEAVRKLDTEPARLRELDAIENWTSPGPGGFYDNLGDPRRRPHLVPGSSYEQDPASLHGPRSALEREQARYQQREPKDLRQVVVQRHEESGGKRHQASEQGMPTE